LFFALGDLNLDNYFEVRVIAQTPNPQTVIYAAMHQDYSEDFVASESFPSEEKCGEILVRRLLSGGRGHFGALEHPQWTINAGWFPHSTVQQMRTHRTGISFDAQSGRYTGRRIVDLAEGKLKPNEVFYLRPVGEYSDRNGKCYKYTEDERKRDVGDCLSAAKKYAERIEQGFSEEHARGLIPFDFRQHWIMSANVRTMLHLFDLRSKADAQLECQQLCELMWEPFNEWVPAISDWYEKNRKNKARLAP
jgi:thymidylate synthase (FAD)